MTTTRTVDNSPHDCDMFLIVKHRLYFIRNQHDYVLYTQLKDYNPCKYHYANMSDIGKYINSIYSRDAPKDVSFNGTKRHSRNPLAIPRSISQTMLQANNTFSNHASYRQFSSNNGEGHTPGKYGTGDLPYWEQDRRERLKDSENQGQQSDLDPLNPETQSNGNILQGSGDFGNNGLPYWEQDRRDRLRQAEELENINKPFNTDVSTSKSSGMKQLTHTNSEGKANMVDVGSKPDSQRTAEAVATIFLGETAFNILKENKVQKGDVLTVSQLAGIMAAKKTSDLIPLCHSINLTKVDITFTLNDIDYSVKISSLAKTSGKTGVEMEALTAVTLSALTIYDMCKAVTKDMVISDVKLLSKTGGKSGDYYRN